MIVEQGQTMGISGTVQRFYFYYGWYYGPDGVGRPPR